MFKKILYLISALLFVSPLISSAQVVTPPEVYVTNISVPASVLTTGDTINGQITFQNGRKTEDARDIVYQISLVGDFQSDGLPATYYDTTADQGNVFISASQSTTVPFSYTLPLTVVGQNLGLEIQAYTKAGVPLGWKDLTGLSIASSSKTISEVITITSASLKVGKNQYALGNGPTIHKNEQAVLSLGLKNASGSILTLSPVTEVYKMVISGNPLKAQKDQPVTLKIGEEKTLEINLPLDLPSGVYLANTYFVDSNGQKRSVSAQTRYIIGGPIVTVQSLTSSASSVVKGQAFTVTFDHTGTPFDVSLAVAARGKKPSNTSITNASSTLPMTNSTIATVTVTNEKNELVATSTERFDSDRTFSSTVSLVAINSGDSLTGKVVVSSVDGNVLAEFTSNLSQNQKNVPGQNWLMEVVAAIMVVIIAVIIFWRLIKRKNTGVTMALLFLFIVPTVLFFAPSGTHAWVQPNIGYPGVGPGNCGGFHECDPLHPYDDPTYFYQPGTPSGTGFLMGYTGGRSIWDCIANVDCIMPGQSTGWWANVDWGIDGGMWWLLAPVISPSFPSTDPANSVTINQPFNFQGTMYALACTNSPLFMEYRYYVADSAGNRIQPIKTAYFDASGYRYPYHVSLSASFKFSLPVDAISTPGTYRIYLLAINSWDYSIGSNDLGFTEGYQEFTVGGGASSSSNAPTASLSAAPTSVTSANNTSTLSWSSTNATYCTASNDQSSSDWIGTKAISGNQAVYLSATTTYSVTCSNATATSAPATVTVGYVAAEVNVPGINASPETYTVGGNEKTCYPTGSKSAIALSITKVNGASAYNIYRSTDNVNFTVIEADTTLATLTDDDNGTGLVPDQVYYYKVSAIIGGAEGQLSGVSHALAPSECSSTPVTSGSCKPQVKDRNGNMVDATLANVGQQVTWIDTSFTDGDNVSWLESSGGQVKSTGQTYAIKYSTIGQKMMYVKVNDGDVVQCLLSPLQIINNPNFKEF